jgi:sucrose-phosphate synthase
MRIAFLNPHGNICSDNCYVGQNSDIGGQSIYVFELAYAMAKKNTKVDIFTRQIIDIKYPKLSQKEEIFLNGNLRIIRIPFGGKGFLKKEEIWMHLRTFINGVISFYNKEKRFCNFISSHYGDGGICAAIIYKKLKISYSFTAHSLGIQKIEMLKNTKNSIMNNYNIKTRVFAERQSMKNSFFNVISTLDERYNKYSSKIYKGVIDIDDDSKFALIPPGVDRKIFNEYEHQDEDFYIGRIKKIIKRDIKRNRQKLPYVVSLGRIDKTKNQENIVKAYCENKKLNKSANLLIQIRGVENPLVDYSNLDKESKSIVERILSIVDYYNIYGKICFTDLKSKLEISVCYRYLSNFKSIFCLTSYYESFGLSYLEAMACGLPVVVTDRGGPNYVLKEGKENFGILVNPYNTKEIANKIYSLINNKKLWEYYKQQGLNIIERKYSWELAAQKYIEEIEKRLVYFNKDYFKLNCN